MMWVSILLMVIVILLATLSFTIFGLYQKNTNVICKSKKRLEGKTVVVTGGTSGLGLEVATDFAERGAKVIIACPFQNEGDNAQIEITQETGNYKVIFKLLDLNSQKSVRKFAENILDTEDRLDILMNNAGVAITPNVLNADRMQSTMQVNYFGHFLLTVLLLPLLKKTGTQAEPSRIVSTSSMLHRVGRIEIENLNKTTYWFSLQSYTNSKLCLIMFSRELAKILSGTNVVVNAADPGAVGTRIFRQLGCIGPIATFIYKNFTKNPWEGAQTLIHLAIDPKAAKISGEYFKDCKVCKAKKMVYDDTISKKLWDESIRLVKLNDEEIKGIAFPAEVS